MAAKKSALAHVIPKYEGSPSIISWGYFTWRPFTISNYANTRFPFDPFGRLKGTHHM